MNQTVCRVHLLDLPFHADRPFDYFIPQGMSAQAGDFVLVPFGGGNRASVALVTAVCEGDGERKLKPVYSVLYPEYSLDEDTMALVRFLSDRTLCSYGEAVKAILPIHSFASVKDAYSVAEGAQGTGELIDLIRSKPGITKSQVEKKLGKGAFNELKDLIRSGEVIMHAKLTPQNKKYNEMVTLADDADALIAKVGKRSKKRIQIIEFLKDNGRADLALLKERFALTRAQLTEMQALGLVSVTRTDSYRTPYEGESVNEEIVLSEEQKSARDTLCALADSGEAKAALLYGVTGSGKTQVMRAVMDHVIASGRGVILLVPEIALTPQTVGIFSRVYGERIAVIHSALSAGERFDEWRRIREGKVDVCIGTRSAVFAPFPNLGLIVMDEEQEHTYKSDQNPKYHARDVARFRCASHGAMMLLASATPSIESFHRAQTGRYTLVRLRERYGDARLPEAIMADLRQDSQSGDDSVLGSVLRKELEKNLQAKEQSILFVNRRGYNNFLSCNMCGTVRLCPHCSVSLTYHAKGRYRTLEGESIPAARARNGYLTCHYCGYREAVPDSCAECGNKVLQFMGYGTQLAENYLKDNYPDARVLRMDADTTQNKFSYDEMLGDFRASHADVLLGTQMVTKGHDFPDVTLVGVLNADSSLYLDDYRANERTFSLVTQVVGRAGRAEKAGRAVIQTYSPDHAVLRQAAEQNYDGFYRDEIAMRRALVFPPFCDMVLFSFSASREETVIRGSAQFAEKMKECLAREEWSGVNLQAFGPFESPIYKKQDRYHMRLVIKCLANVKTRSLFAYLLRSYSAENKKLNIQIDINPTNL